MKKLFFKFLGIGFAAILATCSDDEKSSKATGYDPLKDYLTEAGLIPQDTLVDAGDYEFGISFRAAVPGNITAVVVKLPDNETNIRVTIWDAETETVLRTETVSTVKAHKEKTMSIDPLPLEADHDYMITFNSDDWYDFEREDGEPVVYPIEAGPISVLGYSYFTGVAQSFPDSPQDTYYAGNLSFLFKVLPD